MKMRLSILAVGAFCILSLTAKAQEKGTPWVGQKGVTESTAAIMARERSSANKPREFVERPEHGGPLRVPLPREPRPYLPQQTFAAESTTAAAPALAQTPSTNFLAATWNDTGGAFPPDTMGAAGPSQFIIALNDRIRSFSKNGSPDGAIDTGTDSFFASVTTPGYRTTDPRIRYDRLTDRWFIAMIDFTNTTPVKKKKKKKGTPAPVIGNRVLLAVSDNGVITSSTNWTFFSFDHTAVAPTGDTGFFADYPTLGVDANALYVGTNEFNSNTYVSSSLFVIRKSSVVTSGPIMVSVFRNLSNKSTGGMFTPHGVDNIDPAATEGYVIAADSNYESRLNFFRVTDPGGTPLKGPNMVLDTPVDFNEPVSVNHLGNTGKSAGQLDPVDSRLQNVFYRNDHIWAAHNIGVDNTGASAASTTITRDGVRWYDIANVASGETPTFNQIGTIFQASAANTNDQRSYWMGSISVSGQGVAALGSSIAGSQEYINAAVTDRLASDATGTMRDPVPFTNSSTAYNPRNTNPRRWGDYSFTTVDPNDDMTMWTVQEYCSAQDTYGIQVLKLVAPPPATPTNASPNSVQQGATNQDIAITGTQVDGSGFFDPGATFPNHLTASVSEDGVTVNNVTYTDPAHFTMNISVALTATPDTRTVTVTNPDGQSVTSAPILTVTLPLP